MDQVKIVGNSEAETGSDNLDFDEVSQVGNGIVDIGPLYSHD